MRLELGQRHLIAIGNDKINFEVIKADGDKAMLQAITPAAKGYRWNFARVFKAGDAAIILKDHIFLVLGRSSGRITLQREGKPLPKEEPEEEPANV